MPAALVSTNLALPNRRVGKVRDIYDLPPPPGSPAGTPPRLLIIATDRLSAFDVVLPTPLPGKGRILTDMAVFWLRFIEEQGICRTHLLSTSTDEIPDAALAGLPRADLEGRVMIARRCRVIPVECVVRGYLEGSGWKDYQATGAVCGIPLPPGLQQCSRLPEPIFTPATKEAVGTHDQNISYDQAVAHLTQQGWPDAPALMARLRDTSIAIFTAASTHTAARGLLLADTKFEFGLPLDEPTDRAGVAGVPPATASAASTPLPPRRGGGVTRGSASVTEGDASSPLPRAGEVPARPGEAGGGGAYSALPTPILIDEALTPDSSRFWPADDYAPGRPQRSFDKQFVREYLEQLVSAGQWNKAAPGPAIPPDIVEKTLARYRQARERLLA